MSIYIGGGINLQDSIINTEFRLAVLELVVDKLIKVAPPGTITPQDIQAMREVALSNMKSKYPEAGLHIK